VHVSSFFYFVANFSSMSISENHGAAMTKLRQVWKAIKIKLENLKSHFVYFKNLVIFFYSMTCRVEKKFVKV
jgi:hypothetical protein